MKDVDFSKEEIREIRESLGMTQSAFAEELGVTKESVYLYESGGMHPRGAHLENLLELQERAEDEN